MHRKKQAHIDTPIGTWCVHNGVLTIMGITIAAALAMAPTLRDLQVVELWSGVGAIVAAAEKHNYNTTTFDLNRIPGVTDVPGEHCEDITTLEGFKKAICLVLRLGEGALLAVGPDYGSFTFPNSGRHKRHLCHEHGFALPTCECWQLDGCYCIVLMPARSGTPSALRFGEPTRLTHVPLLSECLARFHERTFQVSDATSPGSPPVH